MDENILARFGFPRKIITCNAQAFKYVAMIEFCSIYNIILGHSISYYPLHESSNKFLMRVINKLLVDNKRNWDSKIIYVLWDDRIITMKSIGTLPF